MEYFVGRLIEEYRQNKKDKATSNCELKQSEQTILAIARKVRDECKLPTQYPYNTELRTEKLL